MLDAIGNTPLVRLRRVVPEKSAAVLVKLEYLSPTGSYKDRMALAMIAAAERRGDLKPGMTVVEWTGGSTGISLAFVCAVKGYRFRVVSSNAVAAEKLRSMQVFGAELDIVNSPTGKLTPDLVPRMTERARRSPRRAPSSLTDQMRNRDASRGLRRAGENCSRRRAGLLDAFCASHRNVGDVDGCRARAERRGGAAAHRGFQSRHVGGALGRQAGRAPRPGARRRDCSAALRSDAGRGEARARSTRWRPADGVAAGARKDPAGVHRPQRRRARSRSRASWGEETVKVTVAVDSGMKYLAGDLLRRGPQAGL